MTASLHNSLIALASQAVRSLPAPLRRVLDAWSLGVARQRALQRQRKWLQQKKPSVVPVQPPVYHPKPWRD